MKGDFSRETFNKRKHYASVLMQQGRVQVDADWNEQQAITQHRQQTEAADIIGPCGYPQGSSGFFLKATPDDKDLVISPGRLYVDGILCELEEATAVSIDEILQDRKKVVVATVVADNAPFQAGEWVEIPGIVQPFRSIIEGVDPTARLLTLREEIPSLPTGFIPQLRRITTCATQPDLRSDSRWRTGTYLAYLDVWLRLSQRLMIR